MNITKFEGDTSVSPCRILTIWKPSDNDPSEQAEYARLEAKLLKLNNAIDETSRGIEQMEHELNLENEDMLKYLAELEEELSALFLDQANNRRQENLYNENEPEKEASAFSKAEEEELARIEAEARQKSKARYDEEAEKQQKEQSQKVKKLFRKIANKTHPDKTKDIELHALFLQARKCYVRDDYSGLQLIWAEVQKKGSQLLRSLMSRIEELKELIVQREKDFFRIRNGQEYRMWSDYKVPALKKRVIEHHRSLIESNIKGAIKAIRSFDSSRHVEDFEPRPTAKKSSNEKPKEAQDVFSAFKNRMKTKTVMGEEVDTEQTDDNGPWA